MPKLRESILADIIAKNIRPRPRWQYILLHAGLWSIGVITIILGSFACAAMILEFSLPERAYLRWMEMQESAGWILALPYLWGIGMIAALTLGYFIFSRTERGYRLRAGLIAGILVLGSLVGGGILYITHTIHWGEREMQRFAPKYRDFRQGFTHMMPRPEDGVLPIRVSEITGDAIIGIAPDHQRWEVHLKCLDDACRERKKKIVLNRLEVFEGKIVGVNIFDSFNILPRPKNPIKMRQEGLSSQLKNTFQKKGN